MLCQQDPGSLRKFNIDAVPLTLGGFLETAWRSDRIIVAGGTHLQFLKASPIGAQYRVLFSWLMLTMLARGAGAAVEMRAVGVGPLDSKLSRFIARWICRLTTSISVRDVPSRVLISDWGLSAAVADDLAIPALRRWRDEASGQCRVDPHEYIVAAPAFARCDPHWWVENICEVIATTGVRRVVFFASGRQTGGDDVEAISVISSKLRHYEIEPDQMFVYRGDLDGALQWVDGASVVLAARYHVVVAARALGKPVVADAYHPKVLEALKVEQI